MRTHSSRGKMSDSGFSLIEVSLALMVVGFGLLGIFHLFPAGLRASFDATAETRIGQFADEVLNELHAMGADVSAGNWSGVYGSSEAVTLYGGASIPLDGSEALVQYPQGSGEYMRCECETEFVPGNRLVEVTLRVRYGRAGGYTQTFYTEVYNFGEIPDV